jgi:hypothetical protein
MGNEPTASSALRDLILALTDETARVARDEEETYKVVAYIVSNLLYNARPFPRSWH